MPIECATSLEPINPADFKKIDYAVTGLAFETHTALGRLFDESIYSNELTYRLRQANFEAQQEIEIIVTHKNYKKSYFIDLLINNSIPYELKTSDIIHTKHSAQLLNYLYLTDATSGKILNFRPRSLETHFVSTSLTQTDRKQFNIIQSNWTEGTYRKPLLPTLRDILDDWGTHLQIGLYQDALISLLKDPDAPQQAMILHSNGRPLGQYSPPLLSKDTMLYISATDNHLNDYKKHLQRILQMTNVSMIQWINMSRNTIQLQTLS